MAAGPTSARKVLPQLAPKPKSSIARLSAFFEQQSLVSPRQSIPTSSKSESPPAQKFFASLPTPDPEAHSPASVVDSALEDRVNTLPTKPTDESSSPLAGPFAFSGLVKAMETSQPISTEVVEKIAPTPPIKPKPILAPKPVSLVKSFSIARATGSPDFSHRATFTGTPSPRVQTCILCMYLHHVSFENLTLP